jgi:cytidine deaminase
MEIMIKTMIDKALNALPSAYAPYSNYTVAACLCTEENTFFSGVNVENASYGLTSCAEASAICQMVTAGHRRIQSMVILAGDNRICPPCGGCRQRIHEFSSAETIIYLCNKDSIIQTFSMDTLLPIAFTLKHPMVTNL